MLETWFCAGLDAGSTLPPACLCPVQQMLQHKPSRGASCSHCHWTDLRGCSRGWRLIVLPVVAQLALPLEVLLTLHLVDAHLQRSRCKPQRWVTWMQALLQARGVCMAQRRGPQSWAHGSVVIALGPHHTEESSMPTLGSPANSWSSHQAPAAALHVAGTEAPAARVRLGPAMAAHLDSDVACMHINHDQSSTGGTLQAGQLPAHQADDFVQLSSALLAVLGQALGAPRIDGPNHFPGPEHLQGKPRGCLAMHSGPALDF